MPWFNIKMSSYQYKKSHCGDKTVIRSSYLHNGISYTGNMTSLYWISPLDTTAAGTMGVHLMFQLNIIHTNITLFQLAIHVFASLTHWASLCDSFISTNYKLWPPTSDLPAPAPHPPTLPSTPRSTPHTIELIKQKLGATYMGILLLDQNTCTLLWNVFVFIQSILNYCSKGSIWLNAFRKRFSPNTHRSNVCQNVFSEQKRDSLISVHSLKSKTSIYQYNKRSTLRSVLRSTGFWCENVSNIR